MGEISRSQANQALRAHFCDPELAYKIFEHLGETNPTIQRRDQLAASLIRVRDEISEKLSYLKAELQHAILPDDVRRRMGRDIKSLLSPRQIPALEKLFGKESAMVMSQVIFALQKEKRGIVKEKPSTVIDAVHSLYLPHADLWQGDRDFSSLLRRHKVNHFERVVSGLRELPDRIEAEIALRKALS